mgnify:CR=1 FL=1
MPEPSFASKVVLVTGGTRGLGRAIALAFASRGAATVLTYRWGTADEDEVRGAFRAVGGSEPLLVQADAAEDDDTDSLIEAVRAQHSGIDVTPCHDSEGNWAPTPDCGAMPYEPGNGSGAGTWASGCSEGPVSGFGALCGDAFGSGEDMDPPTVSIATPGNGDVFDIPPGETQAEVTIEVAADDGDGFGVAQVRLKINGAEFQGNVDTTAPYTWTLV